MIVKNTMGKTLKSSTTTREQILKIFFRKMKAPVPREKYFFAHYSQKKTENHREKEKDPRELSIFHCFSCPQARIGAPGGEEA